MADSEWRVANKEERLFHSLFAIRYPPTNGKRPRKGFVMQLKDVSVLITGGGSGLGAATARAMAAKGAKIAVLDQSKENAEKVAAEVKGVALVGDGTSQDAAKAAIAGGAAARGTARTLVNGAGIGGSAPTVGNPGVYPLDKFPRVVMVSLVGTSTVLRLFTEALLKEPPGGEERGVIINTASV